MLCANFILQKGSSFFYTIMWSYSIYTKYFTLSNFSTNPQHIALTSNINNFFQDNYGLKTNVLRASEKLNTIRIYEIEVLNDDQLLHNKVTWLDLSKALGSNKLNGTDKSLLENWLKTSNIPSTPWFKAGWRENMELKVTNSLNKDLKFEQIRSWERSSLFKITSNNRELYLKAVPNVFSHEPLISNYLYQQHPTYVPEIVDVNQQENWYIMHELNGPLLGESKNIKYWRQALLRLANIQLNSVSQIYKLEELNCPLRSVTTIIRNHFKSSLENLYQTGYITDHTYSQLINQIPDILSKCKKIDSTNIPFALEHGDFFGGNIIIDQNEPKIYDWSDSALSHPFLSIIVLLDEINQIYSDAEANQLLSEYLEHWVEYDSKENLYNEYQNIQSLAPIYYLTLYQTFFFPAFRDNFDKKQIIDHYINESKEIIMEKK